TDNFTGNHTFDDAATLAPESKKYTGLNVCPGLADWFAITLPKGKALKATVDWKLKKDAGLIGIQIIDSSGTGILAGSANPLKTEALLPYLQVGGTYYIHTYVLPVGNKPSEPYDYTLDVAVTEPNPSDVCDADVYESNNSAATAVSIGCGLASMSLCLGDEDWFFISLDKGEKVTIKFTHAGSGFICNLYDNPKLAPLQALNGTGTISFTAPTKGKYYLQTAYKTPGKKPSGAFTYELFVDGGAGVDLVPTIKSLFPDKVEQGEDTYLTMNIANACKDKASAFSYAYFFSQDKVLDAGDKLVKELKVAKGLEGKNNKDFDDKVPVPVDAKPGPAYILLQVDSLKQISESQELNNVTNATLTVKKLCLDDILEPNNAPTVASPVYTGTVKDLSICPFETDWFTFDAVKGETITATIAFTHAEGDLDIRLYEVGKFNSPIASSATKKSPEQIVYVAPKTTKYYLRVKGFTDNSNSYAMSFCKSDKGACFDCLTNLQCEGKGTFCGNGTCKKLGCTVGDNSTCADGNACTDDACVADKGCVNLPVAATKLCDDGDKCSAGESCQSGSCKSPGAEGKVSLVSNSGGRAGQVGQWSGRRLYVGSRGAGKGGLSGRLELHEGIKKLWTRSAKVKGFAVTHLAAAVSRTDAAEIIAVGWSKSQALTAPTSTTQTVAQVRSGPGQVNPADTVATMARVNSETGALISITTVGSAGSALSDIHQAPGGTFVAVGRTANGANGQDAWVTSFDSSGKQLWSVTLGGADNDGFAAVVKASDLGWYVVGVDRGNGLTKGLLAHVSIAGKLIWSQSYSPASAGNLNMSDGWFASADLIDDKTLLVAGATNNGSSATLGGWAAWLSVGVTNTAATVSDEMMLPGQTPQDAAYTGAKQAWFEEVTKLPNGSYLLAGASGAITGAKGGMDAAVWLMSSKKQVTKQLIWGGADHEVCASAISVGGAMQGFGTQSPHTLDKISWIEGIMTPAKVDCDDSNPCTTDSCSAKTGCGHKAVKDGTSCGAGAQTCNAGVCQ
ncbi:MAG TPA: hypothetical protein DCQ06_11200, partial [Myxococcales bacterium]|nr:hypothetical protein [Myxococcales bacterium]